MFIESISMEQRYFVPHCWGDKHKIREIDFPFSYCLIYVNNCLGSANLANTAKRVFALDHSRTIAISLNSNSNIFQR